MLRHARCLATHVTCHLTSSSQKKKKNYEQGMETLGSSIKVT